jgi:hypothetical protein
MSHVVHFQATVEFEKKKRSRLQETDEHEKRPEGLGPTQG